MRVRIVVVSSLRWIAVLPGALITASLARFIVGSLNTWTIPDADGLLEQFGIGCIMGTSFPVVLVFSGAWIAPVKKNAAGLGLAIMFLMAVCTSVVLILSGAPTSVQISDPMVMGEVIAAPVAGVYALVMAWRGKL